MSFTADLKALLETSLASPIVFRGFSPPPVPPDAEYPYVTCREIGGADMSDLVGRNGLGYRVIDLSIWDKDFERGWEARKDIKGVLCPIGSVGYRGPAGDGVIKGVNHSTDRHFWDGERELHQLIASFIIWWEV